VRPGCEERFRAEFASAIADGLRVQVRDPAAPQEFGARYLGVGVGSQEYQTEFVRGKVEGWARDLRHMAAFAKRCPHQAYALQVGSLVRQWGFVMRTHDVDPQEYAPLERALRREVLPAMFRWEAGDLQRRRMALPTRMGGMALPDPMRMALRERGAVATQELEAAIREGSWEYREDREAVRERAAERREAVAEEEDGEAWDVWEAWPQDQRTGFDEGAWKGASAWLGFIPLEDRGWGLTPRTFRDAVALRMGVEPADPFPRSCPSCGGAFSVAHALKCHNGGWVRRRHGEIVRAWMAIFKKVNPAVVEEPLLPMEPGTRFDRPTTTSDLEARADIMARGVFEEQEDAYFDVSVVATGALANRFESSDAALRQRERRKRAKYDERVRPLGSFTPLVCSVHGTLAPEAERVLRRMEGALRKGEEKPRACSVERMGLQISIIKASSLCLRARCLATVPEVEETMGELDDPVGVGAGARMGGWD
jgi:hypothetical protein